MNRCNALSRKCTQFLYPIGIDVVSRCSRCVLLRFLLFVHFFNMHLGGWVFVVCGVSGCMMEIYQTHHSTNQIDSNQSNPNQSTLLCNLCIKLNEKWNYVRSTCNVFAPLIGNKTLLAARIVFHCSFQIEGYVRFRKIDAETLHQINWIRQHVICLISTYRFSNSHQSNVLRTSVKSLKCTQTSNTITESWCYSFQWVFNWTTTTRLG